MLITKFQKIFTTIGIMLVMFLVSLDMLVVTNALPKITTTLGGSNLYTWVITGYTLVLTISTPIMGKLSDLYGRKRLYVGGVAVFIIGSILCGTSDSMLMLIIFRCLQAVGGGTVMGLSLAIISDIFSASEVGKYMGVVMSMSALASLIGPSLGGFITDTFSWHWIFFLNIPVAVVAIIVLIIGMPRTIAKSKRQKIDYLGAVLIAAFTVALMLAMTWGGQKGNGGYDWNSSVIISLLMGSLLALILFVFVEHKAEEPLIPLDFFKRSIYSVSNLLNFLISIVLMSVMVFIPEYLQTIKGYTATHSGALQTPLLVSMTVASIVSGQLVARTGKYKILILLGGVINVIGSAFLITLTHSSSDTQIMLYQAILGFGAGLVYPVLTIAIRNIFTRQELGAATSSFQFFKNFSTSIGVAVLGALIADKLMVFKVTTLTVAQTKADILAGKIAPSTASNLSSALTKAENNLMTNFRTVFIACTVVAIAVFIISFFLREIPLKDEEETAKIEQ